MLKVSRLGLSLGLITVMNSTVVVAASVPTNTLHLEENVRVGQISEIDEIIFDRVADRIFDRYDAIAYYLGGDLSVNANWEAETVFASASQDDSLWKINIYGGLARRPEMTVDGLTVVACHELGHHLAGYPQATAWSAAEGNSDYFALYACARDFWRDDLDINALYQTIIPAYPRQLCDLRYASQGQDRQNLCYREMMAGFSLAELLAYLEDGPINWDEPEKNEVRYTNLNYPSAQCRFDTLMQSALCDARFDFNQIPWNEKEIVDISCHQNSGAEVGLRPRCWFKSRL